MKSSVMCLAVLAVLAVDQSGAAPSSRSCRCWIAADLFQRGRLIGRYCYSAGLGRCGSFTLDDRTGHVGSFTLDDRTGHVGFRSPLWRRFSAPQPRSGATSRRRFSARQQRQAQLATQRQLEQRRRQEKLIASSGLGVVRPGSPSAALAHEKRADAKSLALGQQALAQILYLQNLVGTGRR